VRGWQGGHPSPHTAHGSPHVRTPPHPSGAVPVVSPSDAHVSGVQVPMPPQQSPCIQAKGGSVTALKQPGAYGGHGQLPHWRRLPQPSETGPCVAPSDAQVCGTHVVKHALH
jgi:hypothetical protein